ncbi:MULTISPECIES: molecular chaperone HtpG [unclassified Mesorhizobium]|uniref:molecular chaperone HtpG n=2 Tax=Mesorhizobium TaxID=68287 RepID=UPI000BAFEFE3|nr:MULTISPECIES: molecular chaperone HtpG [unclassified Mesorhizobium]TGT61076.1 molecular chaperone HtpG [Mesorhizobium sp. M00.F.Ca.ET.170.01.1.1]AZO08845.1 molecular chaperone HtpG [Mesorhizobium sp. M3A.F.Ca.ET.080.04.2.1]PBB84013.1 molecular chaperone HtpG [Mesorhizobium sp. WSM3876]RWB83764.1 MAG: molecular chaperone HtpG [Mesorhizobium sp.]TGS72144.1 molecular chaperone HtpG [Mesorhizobium sp. M3A.F.Ca.ET.201.01.1.1]
MTTDTKQAETRTFEADVSRLLHMMVHSVYSDRDVFLRELISNGADASEKLRFEAISRPELLGDDPKPRITISADPDNKQLAVEDNGIGMARDEMAEALGTIARSGTRAFIERIEAGKASEDSQLIGQFGVGFYSVFMVADHVDVISRQAGSEEAWRWSSDGKGTYEIAPVPLTAAPKRGTRVVLHLMEDATSYTTPYRLEGLAKSQSGHVPVPIALVEKPGAEARDIADGTALWVRQKSEIKPEEYTDFYRSIAGQYDEPATTIHFRAEGRQEYSVLAFVPGSRPFDLFDQDRKGRMKLYVRRVFITDDADVVPRYLRFVRGLVDSADLPLNVSREMIQESPLLASIRKGVTNRVLGDLAKLADNDAEAYAKVWENFGVVLKEGLYEDYERREQLMKLARFRSTASSDALRSLADYVAAMKEGQKAIFFMAGDDRARLEASPQLEGFRARGIEVLLLTDPVDSFWVTMAPEFDGKPLKSVTQGAAELTDIPLLDASAKPAAETTPEIDGFLTFVKSTLGDEVADVKASDRLTESAVCLVAPEHGPDRQFERLLNAAGRLDKAAKPILEINPRHERVAALARLGDDERGFKEDAAHLLYDEARVLDGDKPADARAFSARLARLIERGLAKG